MLHSNFTHAIDVLEKLALEEIASALDAHFGLITFNPDNSVIIVGSFYYTDSSENIILTRITSANKCLKFYGIPACYPAEEQRIEAIEPAYYGYILNMIPPSLQVDSVIDIEQNCRAMESLQAILLGIN